MFDSTNCDSQVVQLEFCRFSIINHFVLISYCRFIHLFVLVDDYVTCCGSLSRNLGFFIDESVCCFRFDCR
ncbi:hypothetical protein Hanom_Chr15g01344721 [Helianthus anomalus]